MKTPLFNEIERQIMIQYPDDLPALRMELKLELLRLIRALREEFKRLFL